MGARNDIKRKVEILDKVERATKVRQMSTEGMSAREIARTLGVSHTTVYSDLNEIVAKATEENKQDIEEKRRVVVFRHWDIYDTMNAVAIRDGNPTAARIANEALMAIAKIEGLNAPEKIAPTDPEGNKEYAGLGLDSSGAARLVALFNGARARRDHANNADGADLDAATGPADDGGGN